MIRVERVGFAYGPAQVLSGVEFGAARGEIVGVVGPNGAGKSTLLRLLSGALRPREGRVLIAGEEAHRLPRRRAARLVAVVPQGAVAAFPYSVGDVVRMGRYAHGAWFGTSGTGEADRRAVATALALTRAEELVDRPVTRLSGGEFQRVLLARALAQAAPVLLLDEPTSHLDLDHRCEIAELLLRLNREEGTTVVLVSHDLELAAELCHRLVLLARGGAQVAHGSPGEVLVPSVLRRVYRVELQVEPNPWTGRPRLVLPSAAPPQGERRVHLFCGGGTGAELLRALRLGGWRVSAGPLAKGDSDLLLARRLGAEVVEQEAFSGVTPRALERAGELARRAEAVVLAPPRWGEGTLGCLRLGVEALADGRRVYLAAAGEPLPGAVRALADAGAEQVEGAGELLRLLGEVADR